MEVVVSLAGTDTAEINHPEPQTLNTLNPEA